HPLEYENVEGGRHAWLLVKKAKGRRCRELRLRGAMRSRTGARGRGCCRCQAPTAGPIAGPDVLGLTLALGTAAGVPLAVGVPLVVRVPVDVGVTLGVGLSLGVVVPVGARVAFDVGVPVGVALWLGVGVALGA